MKSPHRRLRILDFDKLNSFPTYLHPAFAGRQTKLEYDQIVMQKLFSTLLRQFADETSEQTSYYIIKQSCFNNFYESHVSDGMTVGLTKCFSAMHPLKCRDTIWCLCVGKENLLFFFKILILININQLKAYL